MILDIELGNYRDCWMLRRIFELAGTRRHLVGNLVTILLGLARADQGLVRADQVLVGLLGTWSYVIAGPGFQFSVQSRVDEG